jgi:hypothetical protein
MNERPKLAFWRGLNAALAYLGRPEALWGEVNELFPEATALEASSLTQHPLVSLAPLTMALRLEARRADLPGGLVAYVALNPSSLGASS